MRRNVRDEAYEIANTSEDLSSISDYSPKILSERKELTYKKWNSQECKLYIEFLRENKYLFVEEHNRRSQKVFKRMSEEKIPHKTPEQCRSHHQKQAKKHNEDVDKIINAYYQKVQRQHSKEQRKRKVKKEQKKIMKQEKEIQDCLMEFEAESQVEKFGIMEDGYNGPEFIEMAFQDSCTCNFFMGEELKQFF